MTTGAQDDNDGDRAAAQDDVTREQDLLEEASVLAELVARVVRSDGAEAPAVHERFRQILSKYQEQPQLLDGHLEELVCPLARLLRRRAALAAERQPAPPPGAGAPAPPLAPADTAAALDVGRLLGAVVSVRGAKAVARFLTHEAADLEVALGLLLRLEAAEKAAAEAAAGGGAPLANAAWSAAEGAAARSWPWQETQAVVLLWLSLLALAPFDLAVLDSSLDCHGAGGGGSGGEKHAPPPPPPPSGLPPLARRLASACAARLHETGAAREMAALVLARLLTRPDMSALLAEFFEWQRAALERAAAALGGSGGGGGGGGGGGSGAAVAAATNPSFPSVAPSSALDWPAFPTDGLPPAQAAARATFFAPGALRALGLAFKLGPRAACAPLAARAWAQLEALLEEGEEEGGGEVVVRGSGAGGGHPLLSASPLARKLVAKLAQRVALVLLPPPAAAARAGGAGGGNVGGGGGGSGNNASTDQKQKQQHRQEEDEAGAQPLELHEAVEAALGRLLDGALADRDTVVRWSGAKGAARVAAALPSPALADEVVGSVLETLFVEGGSDAAWHGGCLALAELARRGCLPPERLAQAAPLVARALAFDAPARGGCAGHSVGAHVRDAAAYACWALARAFGGGAGGGGGSASCSPAAAAATAAAATAAAAVERAFLDWLAPALLAAACYDREVNCRRAAAAAFQEAVGRLGGDCLAHGLEALHAAQYASVGQASRAALRVAPRIAALGERGGYRPALVEALVERQLRHWDARGTRALAAKALAALVPALVPAVATTMMAAPSRFSSLSIGGKGASSGGGGGGVGGVALLTGEGGAVETLLGRVGAESTLEERTGALLALGEVLPALAAAHTRQAVAAAATAAAAAAAATAAAAAAAATGGAAAADPPPPPPLELLRLRPADAAAAAGLLPRVAACGLYRGRGGEAVREAAARLLEGLSRAQEAGAEAPPPSSSSLPRWSLPLDDAHHDCARLLLDDCSRHPSERVRKAGESALRAYARSLVGAAARTRSRSGTTTTTRREAEAEAADTGGEQADAAAASALPALEALVDRTWPERLLTDPLPIHRRGAAGALGALPAALLLLLPSPSPAPGQEGSGDAGAAPLAERRRARPEAILRALAAASLEGAELADPDDDDDDGTPPPLALPAAPAAPLPPPLPAECRDAEARAEAAAALGRACAELWPASGGHRGPRDDCRALEEEEEEEEEAGGKEREEDEDDKEEEEKKQGEQGEATGGGAPGDEDEGAAPTPSPDRALLPAIVLPALLAACRDCTTDSRGDAGAWVREAAVGALGRALPAALELAAEGGAAAAGEGEGHGKQRAALLCRDAVGALLQQALGRIARLRHAALRELRAVLPLQRGGADDGPAPAARRVLPGADAVSRAVYAERDIEEAGVASLAAFRAVASLLVVPPDEEGGAGPRPGADGAAAAATALPAPSASAAAAAAAAAYRYPWLLEGVVAAAGGVDVALARAAGRALARAASAGSSPAAAAAADGGVAGGLARLWARVQRRGRGGAAASASGAATHARLATPLVRAALLVLRKGGRGAAWLPVHAPAVLAAQEAGACALGGGGGPDGAAVAAPAPASATTTSFAAAVVALLRAEVRGCTDIPRLVDAAALAAELADQASSAAVRAAAAAAAAASEAGAAASSRGGAPPPPLPPPLDQLLALRADAVRLLLVLLGNRYPRVRRAAAEAAYVAALGMRADAAAAADAAGGAAAGAATTAAAAETTAAAAAAATTQGAPPPPRPPSSLSSQLPTLACLDAAASLLLEGAAWDGPDLAAARAARDALAALLRVEAPRAVAAAAAAVEAAAGPLLQREGGGGRDCLASGADASAAAAAAAAAAALLSRVGAAAAGGKAQLSRCRFDENASYQSLLDDAARGGGY